MRVAGFTRMVVAFASVLATSVAVADTVTLQNDSLTNGSQAAVQAGFVAHDIGGAVFNPPSSAYPLQVTHVQIFWRSLFGGAPDRLERAIRFYQGGAENPPNPQLVFTLDAPQLTDGFLNDFDVTALNITYSHGPFSIGLEFDDLIPRDLFTPSLVTDRDGCQPSKNILYDSANGRWFGCYPGISGDFVVRCVVETSTIPPEVTCRAGNVDTGNGNPPAIVLTVNGSSGDPLTREMTLTQGPANVHFALPPAGGNGLWAGWIFNGLPTASTIQNAFIFNGAGGVESIGTACFCLPSNNSVSPGACPCPLAFPVGFTSKALGAGAAANVCVHRSPADPRAPATITVNLPPGDYSICGILFDPNSSSPGPRKVSLTNLVGLHVTP
ncbi:MAG: hypothetical protein HYR85_06755 [Planctomycetes bacterium]|nr:hypothetical protein [Planctomycetota bacterium]MBI3846451.1 hypothetical protein [Planctomycetota bacterium]